jgi:hypothetical protein
VSTQFGRLVDGKPAGWEKLASENNLELPRATVIEFAVGSGK